MLSDFFVVDPAQPIKVTYNIPEDIPLYNSRIVAAIRSEHYWNYHNHNFLWEPTLHSSKGELEIPPEVWDQVPADDKFLLVGFFDTLSATWYFPPTYVVPFNHSTFF